jgi:two-component system alkaline phosphatase synthesis response regulator PhoP
MNNKDFKVLVVDDDPDILELLQYNLLKEGYDVRIANSGKKAIDISREFLPNLVLMDIMMPNLDGVETCRLMRELPYMKDAHIIFLTARSEEYSEIAAFEVGADDYIIKPIKPRALMSRISAIFKKENKASTKQINTKEIPVPIVTLGNLIIDKESYLVKKGNKSISLPKKEFELLYFLATNPNKVFNREELLQTIWGSDVYVLARTVDVHIRKVREKIGSEYIKTIKGVGYKFDPSNAK